MEASGQGERGRMKLGDRVLLTGGPWAGNMGRVSDIKSNGRYGTDVTVELDNGFRSIVASSFVKPTAWGQPSDSASGEPS